MQVGAGWRRGRPALFLLGAAVKRKPGSSYPEFRQVRTPDYSDEEREFLKAMDAWMKRTVRRYPTFCEFLAEVKRLGYHK